MNSFVAQDVLEDLQVLKHALENLHPSLHLPGVFPEFKTFYNHLAHQFDNGDRITKEQLREDISKLIASIQCEHTKLNNDDLIAAISKKGLLPFVVRINDGQLFVNWNFSDDARLKRGVRIETINSHSVSDILDRLIAVVSADGNDLSHKMTRIERDFQFMFSHYYGLPATFSLRCSTDRGVDTVVLDAIDFKTMCINRAREYAKNAEVENAPVRFEILKTSPGSSLAFLSIRTFKSDALRGTGLVFGRYLKKVFFSLSAGKIENLVIDLRGNFGGDVSNALALVSHLIPRSTQYIENVEIPCAMRRFSPWIKMPFWLRAVSAFQSKRLVTLIQNMGLRWFATVTPGKNRFQGKVYYLVDGALSSAAKIPLLINSLAPHATVVGSAQISSGWSNCAPFATVTLPHAEIQVQIPLVKLTYVRSDRPLVDVVVDDSALPGVEEDRVKELVFRMISSN